MNGSHCAVASVQHPAGIAPPPHCPLLPVPLHAPRAPASDSNTLQLSPLAQSVSAQQIRLHTPGAGVGSDSFGFPPDSSSSLPHAIAQATAKPTSETHEQACIPTPTIARARFPGKQPAVPSFEAEAFMKHTWPFASAVLAAALVLSNAAWAYFSLDAATITKARDQEYRSTCHALRQTLDLMPRLTATLPERDVLAAARASSSDEPFEKDGATWIGSLGFYFDPSGRLTRIVPSWEPFDCPP